MLLGVDPVDVIGKRFVRDDDRGCEGEAMDAGRRCLSLLKGRQRYVFWYSLGQESALLASLVDYAERPDLDFDFFDAALLSYQMGKRIGKMAEGRVAVSP